MKSVHLRSVFLALAVVLLVQSQQRLQATNFQCFWCGGICELISYVCLDDSGVPNSDITGYVIGCGSYGIPAICCRFSPYDSCGRYQARVTVTGDCGAPACSGEGGLCGSCAESCCGDLLCSGGTCTSAVTPIMIDLESNDPDYDLTSPVDGVPFDLDADGILEQVSWTEPGSRVGLLALDRNKNGIIDDGTELFGNVTRLSNGERASNGFEALQDLDGGPNSDGRITEADPVFSHLVLWIDRNHDGYSQRNELLTLRQAGIVEISTAYRESKRVDRNGNEYRFVGHATILRNGRPKLRRIFDVILTRVPAR